MNFLHSTGRPRLVAAVLACGLAGLAHADPVALTFSDDFSQPLTASWTDKSPVDPEVSRFTDLLNESNQVMGFNRFGAEGSIFSKTVVSGPTSVYTLSFDYLGVPGRGGRPSDLGGYIGVAAADAPLVQFWIGGNGVDPTPLGLLNDDQWHSYSYTWTSIIGNRLRVVAEDRAGSRRVAGDVYFDNIVLKHGPALNDVPEPTSLALVGLALAATAVVKRRKSAQA